MSNSSVVAYEAGGLFGGDTEWTLNGFGHSGDLSVLSFLGSCYPETVACGECRGNRSEEPVCIGL